MNEMNLTTARKQIYRLVEEVNTTHMPVLLTGKNNNAVLVAAEDWRTIEETLFLNNIPGMVDSLLEGVGEPDEKMVSLKDVDW